MAVRDTNSDQNQLRSWEGPVRFLYLWFMEHPWALGHSGDYHCVCVGAAASLARRLTTVLTGLIDGSVELQRRRLFMSPLISVRGYRRQFKQLKAATHLSGPGSK